MQGGASTIIFINEQNYKQKFQEFLNDPDNEKWKVIAEKGRKHVFENLSNDKAAKDLVNLMKELSLKLNGLRIYSSLMMLSSSLLIGLKEMKRLLSFSSAMVGQAFRLQ